MKKSTNNANFSTGYISIKIKCGKFLNMKIKFLNGKYDGKELEINAPSITVGRDPGNLVSMDTDGVSRCHAEMKQLASGEWMIYDLNSTNGVKVNGQKIDGQANIVIGNTIGIGENNFLITELQNEPAKVIFNPIVSAPPVSGELDEEPAGPVPVLNDDLFGSENKTGEKTEPEQTAVKVTPITPDKIVSEFNKISGPLFGKKNKRSSGENDKNDGQAADPGKRRSNMIFYTVLVCVVIMILSSAFSIMSPQKQRGKRTVSQQPLTVRYEKEVLQNDNVFRFEFYLKNKIAEVEDDDSGAKQRKRIYTIRFTIDDVNSKRHYSKETAVAEETVDQLRSAINGSGIYAAPANDTPRDKSHNRILTIVEGTKLLVVKVPGEYASQEFNTVEETINDIADNFGLKTISLTPEELLSQANDYFLKAEDLFSNRAKTGNLRDAIIRYRAVVESLEQFSPKPKMWDRARKQLEQAIKERDAKLEMFDAEYKRLSHMREFEPMRNVFLNIMELTEPDSKEYARAKRRLVIIDQALRKSKRK